MKTFNLSSNLTVILKYFVPLVWTVFFGALCIIFWMTDELTVGGMDLTMFRIGWTAFFLVGTLTAYFTIMRLLRVEFDGAFLYVTNYFKVFKYPMDNVDKIVIKDYSILKLVTVKLINSGHFGEKVVFIASRSHFNDIVEASDILKDKIR
ncbi:MAG: hypothetical protein AB8G11_10280 [Saprospiraceae bacterium]